MAVRRRRFAVLAFALISLAAAGAGWAQPIPIPIPTPTPPSVAFPPFDPAACVAKPQHLLIFDMKSGWWSGDGAEFHDLLLPRIVKDCPSIDIEYYFFQHLDGENLPPGLPLPPGVQVGVVGFLSFYPERPGTLNGGFMGATYPSRQWNEYSQIWLLSGSNEDPTDVPTTHEFFLNLLAKLSTTTGAAPQQPAPSIFVGSGIGNNDHGNRVLASFQLPELFQTHAETVETPNVGEGAGIQAVSRLRAGVELTSHPLFAGVENVVDRLGIDGSEYETDFLVTANNPFQIVGQNGRGEPSIAVRDTEARRFVIDAGLQRFYSLFSPTEVGTYRYLQNIIKYLAR